MRWGEKNDDLGLSKLDVNHSCCAEMIQEIPTAFI